MRTNTCPIPITRVRRMERGGNGIVGKGREGKGREGPVLTIIRVLEIDMIKGYLWAAVVHSAIVCIIIAF